VLHFNRFLCALWADDRVSKQLGGLHIEDRMVFIDYIPRAANAATGGTRPNHK